MKEWRLRKIEKASKERDMLLRMISLFEHDEDFNWKLEFYDRHYTSNITQKVILVLQERLKEHERYLQYLLYDANRTPKKNKE